MWWFNRNDKKDVQRIYSKIAKRCGEYGDDSFEEAWFYGAFILADDCPNLDEIAR